MRHVGCFNRLLWGVNLVLLGVAAFAAMRLLAPEKTPHETTAVSAGGEVNASRAMREGVSAGDVDPKLILERDVFGAGGNSMAEKLAAMQSDPSARSRSEQGQGLPFRLVGTIVDEKGPSFALLENASTKAQDLYRVGDRIGDSRIDRIEQNNVFVSTLGVRQVLTLVLGPLESKAGMAVAVEPPAPAQLGGQNGEMLRVVSNTERQINTRASSSSADQAAKLLGKMKLKPHTTDGASDGLCVSGLGDSVMAQLSGLQDGDVIQSINGHPVPNQRKAAQVLQKARRLGAAQLELKRGQEKRSLAFRPGSW
ncbi:MAG: hypothetical protein ABFD90_02990 [Phycisphaerales bacterium]